MVKTSKAKDSSKVYIATHTGLLMMQNGGELQRVGNAQDDYMGFSAHPTDPQTFYTSGHPRTGGNLGKGPPTGARPGRKSLMVQVGQWTSTA